jgi:heat shock protein HslJ
MSRPTVLVLLATTLLAAACAAPPATEPTQPPQPATVAGRTFLSAAVTEGGAPRPLVAGTQIRLDFQPDGNLGVTAGCNHIGGTHRIDGTTLVLEAGAMTDMGCDEPRHAQDEWIVGVLTSKPKLALAGADLRLTSGDLAIHLVDREVADPDRPLTGTRWVVDSIRTRDAVSSIPGGATAELLIAEDGTVELETGCNSGSGRAATGGDQLRFSDVATTKRGCVGGAGELEQAVVGVLGAESITWLIEADRLILDAGGIGLELHVG